MPYLPAICPHCSGHLSLDSNMEKGYCIHCGSLINFSEAVTIVKANGPIEFEGYESLPTLLNLIKKAFSEGENQTPEFKGRLIRALELDPENRYLYGLVHSEIWKAEIKNNVLIKYNGNAQKVVLPEGISAIESMAFGSHCNLKEIVLPKSINEIRENAFIFESTLTIRAYKDTYAARYALASPAKLKLMDYKSSDKQNIEDIEYILGELRTFQKITQQKIEDRFSKLYSTKWVIIFLLLVPAFAAIYNSLMNMLSNTVFTVGRFYTGIILLCIIYIISVILFFIAKTGYDEIKRKTATNRQKSAFMKTCNELTKPLGISDFKYYRNIFENFDYDLEDETAKLKIVKKKIFGIDLTPFLKKPYIDYKFIDFLKGDRPFDYKNSK